MKEELISFETAKLANVKGYIGPAELRYNKTGGFAYSKAWSIAAPKQSQLQRWLREEHNEPIWVYAHKDRDLGKTIYRFAGIGYDGSWESNNFWYSYEEALEAGIQEVLKLIDR